METPSAGKQRSPWLYVLLGCGGLAALICLGSMIFVFFVGKTFKDVGEGLTDPAEMNKNAIEQLGALPEGYTVVASLDMYFAKTTMLTDGEVLPDGGFVLGEGHTFAYFRVMANENNKKAKGFLQGKETDPEALRQSGIQIDEANIVKRGQLAVDGRKVFYVAWRGTQGGGRGAPAAQSALSNAILFDCPGDQLQAGVWTQADPAPDKNAEELDLANTVADEAQLVKFLKPMNPCGK